MPPADGPSADRALWHETPDGHRLHAVLAGDPKATPVLLLHGGPGSGGTARLREPFVAHGLRVIQPDQRGSGLSRPRGGTRSNTTADLVDDLERLRATLGIARWWLHGGSWGATLALAYAARHPQAVRGLMLRSVFRATPSDIQAFFMPPDEASPWTDRVPPSHRGRTAAWLDEVMRGADVDLQRTIVRLWSRWEQERSRPAGRAAPEPAMVVDAAAARDRYRIQAHYLAHGCWLPPGGAAGLAAALPPMPAFVLQAVDDRVCPLPAAQAVAQALPAARFIPVQAPGGIGHDALHPAMQQALGDALALALPPQTRR